MDNIIIPSGGNFKHNLDRAKKAFESGGENSFYHISGLGRDKEKPWIYEPHDLTIKDYLLLAGVKEENIFIDYESTNSLENLINTLSNKKGVFKIVSYPLHLDRFNFILDDLQRREIIDEEIELIGIETNQTLKDVVYGLLAEINYLYLGNRIKNIGNFFKKFLVN